MPNITKIASTLALLGSGVALSACGGGAKSTHANEVPNGASQGPVASCGGKAGAEHKCGGNKGAEGKCGAKKDNKGAEASCG